MKGIVPRRLVEIQRRGRWRCLENDVGIDEFRVIQDKGLHVCRAAQNFEVEPATNRPQPAEESLISSPIDHANEGEDDQSQG